MNIISTQMKEEELDKLLEKYYKGESSEDEEITLKKFFQSDSIPEGYEAEKEVFSLYSLSGIIPEPSIDFEERIVAEIDNIEKNRKSAITRKIVLYSLSTAAGLLIIAGSYFFLNNSRELKDTYSDPKIAYAETMKILMDVSSKLNKGSQVLEPLGKINKTTNESIRSINKSARIIGNGLNSVSNLDKAAK